MIDAPAVRPPGRSSPAKPPTLRQLTRRSEFLFVAKGLSERRPNVVIQAHERTPPENSIGIGYTATKKVGNAVIRNRARRRLREASRQLLPQHGRTSVDYVFIARKDTADCPWNALLDDVETALISLRGRIEAGEIPQRTRRARPKRPPKRPKA